MFGIGWDMTPLHEQNAVLAINTEVLFCTQNEPLEFWLTITKPRLYPQATLALKPKNQLLLALMLGIGEKMFGTIWGPRLALRKGARVRSLCSR